MQLASLKRLVGMDESSPKSNNFELQTHGRLEKGSMPITEDENEDGSKYPPLKTVILSMASIYLAFFLSALVRFLVHR